MNRSERRRNGRKRRQAVPPTDGQAHQPVHCVVEEQTWDDGSIQRTHYRLSAAGRDVLERLCEPGDRAAVARLRASGYFLELFVELWPARVDGARLIEIEDEYQPVGEAEFHPLV